MECYTILHLFVHAVEEWKRQLQAYKEENQRLKQATLEAEAARGTYPLLSNSYKASYFE